MTKHVIIGNGPAGVIAAETLRKADPKAEIALLGDEPVAAASLGLVKAGVGAIEQRRGIGLVPTGRQTDAHGHPQSRRNAVPVLAFHGEPQFFADARGIRLGLRQGDSGDGKLADAERACSELSDTDDTAGELADCNYASCNYWRAIAAVLERNMQ